MSKTTNQAASPTLQANTLPWSRRVRCIVSAFLAFHVAAVFIAPWSLPQPASELSGTVAGAIRPYLHGLSINNGYRFFAPNPGASHIVRYRLLLRDGTTIEGQFPDLDAHWPRQLYHRHFMVAETINVLFEEAARWPQPAPPQQISGYAQMTRGEQQRMHAEFQTAGRLHNETKKRLERLVRPIAQRLMIDHDADAVELWSVRRHIPSRQMFIDGASLEDPSALEARWLGRFPR